MRVLTGLNRKAFHKLLPAFGLSWLSLLFKLNFKELLALFLYFPTQANKYDKFWSYPRVVWGVPVQRLVVAITPVSAGEEPLPHSITKYICAWWELHMSVTFALCSNSIRVLQHFLIRKLLALLFETISRAERLKISRFSLSIYKHATREEHDRTHHGEGTIELLAAFFSRW